MLKRLNTVKTFLFNYLVLVAIVLLVFITIIVEPKIPHSRQYDQYHAPSSVRSASCRLA